ncbi:site-specific integrase [Seleniivibrio woodruffii]|uniref:site-specific integrase n=1 Tax=Seleniivibrio woodruffii TaxID=1078050 RepID=UPI002409A9F5|nr:site-specific integrase [Seleniivibrio woodruffii]
MGVYERSGKVWLDFRYKGVRCRESLKAPYNKANVKYAERLLGEIENKIDKDIFNYSDYFSDSKKCILFGGRIRVNVCVEELFGRWMENAEKRYLAGNISLSTFNNYKNEIRDFVARFHNRLVHTVTKADIDDFIADYSVGRKSKSVNNAITTLKQVFIYAVDKEYIDKSPLERISKLRVEKPDIQPFEKEEMFKILGAMKHDHERIYPIVATLFMTGMRTGEVLAMKWENLDTNNWTYHIKESFSKRKLTRTKTEGSNRYIDLSPIMQQIIKAQKSVSFLRSEFIFVNKQGKPYTSSGNIIKLYWKPVLKKLGIEYRIPYQCRHTFAVLSLKEGDDPEEIAKQLGHTTLKMLFTHYARFIKNRKKVTSQFSNMVTKWSHEDSSNNQSLDITEEY